MAIRGSALIAALMAITACGEAPTATASGSASGSPPAATGTVTKAEAPVGAAAPEMADAPALVLEGEGLRLIDPATTHATPVAFGLGQTETLRVLAAAMGGPADQQGTNSECGEGPLQTATWNKGLTTFFQGGKFVGWSGAVDMKTASGIGFGSTRKQLDAAYDVEVEQSSLGTEFRAGGLSGVLESDAPDAAVSDMWAGMACIAR